MVRSRDPGSPKSLTRNIKTVTLSWWSFETVSRKMSIHPPESITLVIFRFQLPWMGRLRAEYTELFLSCAYIFIRVKGTIPTSTCTRVESIGVARKWININMVLPVGSPTCIWTTACEWFNEWLINWAIIVTCMGMCMGRTRWESWTIKIGVWWPMTWKDVMATIVIFCEIVQRILVHIRGYIKENWMGATSGRRRLGQHRKPAWFGEWALVVTMREITHRSSP